MNPASKTEADPAVTPADVIGRLQGLVDDALAPIVADAKANGYALLDFPDYSNVGDSAIWLGETAWLRRLVGAMPAYACRLELDDGALERLVPEGPILLNGGGNFGDIWPAHQRFRERVLERWPGRPVIHMPQSIHFLDPSAIDRTAKIIARHGRFTLLVRDHPSFELATKHFDCEVKLCPDMAFCLGAQQRPQTADSPVLMLMRTDTEKSTRSLEPGQVPADWIIDDWLVDDADLYPRTLRETRLQALASLSPARLSRASREVWFMENLARRRFERGVKLLSRARFIVTDRLHVHILSTLLGIPHVFLDNSYGKIRRFSEAFETRWTGVSNVETLDEAIAIARRATA